ncbi:MAG TPA: hypothetical protein VMU09_08545 [Acidimicrobiales bacterium]|nr:hypothetical protein [Acidimicrobiales bacterium]
MLRARTGAAAAVLAVSMLLCGTAVPVAADVGSDQAQIAALEQKIAADGAQVQDSVAAVNKAQAQLTALQAQVATAQAGLAADRQQLAKAEANLRSIALDTYMNMGDGGTALSLFTSDTTTLSAQDEYTHLAGDRLNAAIDAVNGALRRKQLDTAQLTTAEAQAQATVTQLAGARQGAQGALDRDNALLTGVKGNLQVLLAAAAAAQAAARRAQEAAIAAAPPPKQQGPPPPPVTITPTPGTYVNPLRDLRALNPERIDQGVDYSAFGPIYAIGDGVVLSTTNAGWPGGTFIAYRLTDGKANGLVVYAAEDINPLVGVGQHVTAATVLGTVYEGPSGIETGWADRSGDGATMASGVYSEGHATAFGVNFSQLLASLGAPPGVNEGGTPSGSLPPGWPTW